MASTARGAGIGAFLQSLGQSGMNLSQIIDKKKEDEKRSAAEAPTRELNFSILKDVAASKKLGLDEKKMSLEREKVKRAKLKKITDLLADKDVKEEFIRITDSELAKSNMPIPEAREGMITTQTETRNPTLQKQIERVQGSGLEFDPDVKSVVDPLKAQFQAQQEPGIAQAKFEREQTGKVELQELKGEQASERQLERDLVVSNNPMLALREKGEARREQQFVQGLLTKHVKDTKAFIRTGFLVKNIDKALKETGAGGIFGEGNIKSVGFASKAYRKWLNSKDAVKVRQAVSMFFLGKIKEQSGVAVSDKEFERIESAFGLNNRSTMQAFRESIKIAADETKTQLSQFEKALSPEAKQLLRERDLFTSDDLPGEEDSFENNNVFEGYEIEEVE